MYMHIYIYMNEAVHLPVHHAFSCCFCRGEFNIPSECGQGRLHPVTSKRLELIFPVLSFDSISPVFEGSVTSVL